MVYDAFVGIDLGSQKHVLQVIGSDGKPLSRREIEHSPEGIGKLGAWLLSTLPVPASRFAVAIEVPHGSVVESLLEKGFHIYAINPKQLDRFRDRHSVSGCKDDDRDSLVLATSLRTDPDSFRLLRIEDPLIICLREASRMGDELGDAERRLCNKLWHLLNRSIPQLLKLSSGADEPWLWTLLKLCRGDLRLLAQFSKAKVLNVLKDHQIRRITVEDLQKCLGEGTLQLADGSIKAIGQSIKLIVPQLRLLREQRKENDAVIAALLAELSSSPSKDLEGKDRQHSDVAIILSFKGIGNNIGARMLSEASQLLSEGNYEALRVYSGVAPITKRSGKMILVSMRRSCNGRLRQAMHLWGGVAIQHDERARVYYQSLRQRGKGHSRALRSVSDSLLRRLCKMLKDRSLYQAQEACF
jgi:Transposase/Transposase IS116/IS110/IS902 family